MFALFLFACALFVVGGLLCALNFYLSVLRYPLHRLFGWPYRWVSGFPVFGSLFVAASLCLLSLPAWLFWLAVVLLVLDTGGLHWFAAATFWFWLRPPHATGPDDRAA